MTIYKIDQAIYDCIDEDGEIIDIAKFNELQMDREIKIDNIACWYKQLLYEADAIKNERNILGEREKSKRNQAEGAKNLLSDCLRGQNFETSRNKIGWRASTSINITDKNLIPAEYIKVVTESTPMKEEIKKAIKSGAVIQGAELIEKNNIQIK